MSKLTITDLSKPVDFDGNITFGKPKAVKTAKVITPYFQKGYMTFKSPAKVFTYGAQQAQSDQPSAPDKYNLAIQFPGNEYATDETRAFMANLQNIYSLITAAAVKNGKEWKGKEIKPDSVDDAFYPILKTSKKDESKPPTFGIKLPVKDGNIDFDIYQQKGDKTEMLAQKGTSLSEKSLQELIPNKSRIQCIFQCSGIWFASNMFSITFKMLQVKIFPPEDYSFKYGTCLMGGEDETVTRKRQLEMDTTVEDSDEEQEQEEEHEQEQEHNETVDDNNTVEMSQQTIEEDDDADLPEPVVEQPAPAVVQSVAIKKKPAKRTK